MSSHGQRLFDRCTAVRALLGSVGRIDRYGYLAEFYAKALQPFPELIPTCIINRLSETVILD